MSELQALLPSLKSLWTVWFFLVFVGIVYATLRPRNRAAIEAHGRIPFEEDRTDGGKVDVH